MNRILSALAVAGVLVGSSLAANAAGRFVRSDGIVFDSDVGAACGALHTDVLFEPWSSQLDILDEPVLDHLATCLTSGELARMQVAVVGVGDDRFASPAGVDLARKRMNAVRAYLMMRGVSAHQLQPWAYTAANYGEAQPARVMFRLMPGPALL